MTHYNGRTTSSPPSRTPPTKQGVHTLALTDETGPEPTIWVT